MTTRDELRRTRIATNGRITASVVDLATGDLVGGFAGWQTLPGVVFRVPVLSDAGLIEHRSAGTRNLYALAPDGMAAAQRWLVRTWDTALAANAAEVRRERRRRQCGGGLPHRGGPAVADDDAGGVTGAPFGGNF